MFNGQVFKDINREDYSIEVFPVYKSWTITEQNAENYGVKTSFGITASGGRWDLDETNSDQNADETYKTALYGLINHIYYKPLTNRTYPIEYFGDFYNKITCSLNDSFLYFGIPSDIYGERIQPGSIELLINSYKVIDDSCGNLIFENKIPEILIEDGTETNPYLINTLNDLKNLSEDSTLWDKWFKQTADIDATDTKNWNSGAGFSPIGTDESRFSGGYDGQNYTISNLYINRPASANIGLFGKITNADFVGIRLINVNITGNRYIGGLAGNILQGSISKCVTTGKVEAIGTGVADIGGLVGGFGHFIDGGTSVVMSDCYSKCTVKTTQNGQSNQGGIASYLYYSRIERSYFAGIIERGLNSHCSSFVGQLSIYAGFADNYFDYQVSGNETEIGATKKTTAQMKQQATFTNYNFEDIWTIEENISYPELPIISPPVINTHMGNVFYRTGDIVLTSEDILTGISTGSFELTYRSTLNITNHNIICSIDPGEFCMTYNPTAYKQTEPYLPLDSVLSSSWNPYITSIGLYSENYELIAVGKLGQIVPNCSDSNLNIVVSLDF